MNNIKFDFKPSFRQYEGWKYLEDRTTEEILYGGAAGGGKTYLGCAWKISRRLRYPGTRGIIGRAVLKDLLESTVVTYLKILNQIGLISNVHYTYKQGSTGVQVVFSNGSVEIFKDLIYKPTDQDYQRLGSSEYTDAWIEEGNDRIREKAFEILSSRVRWMLSDYKLTKKVLITCNPGEGWIKKRFIKDENNRPIKLKPYQAFVKSLVTDNPDREFVSHYKKSLEKITNPYDKARLLEGDWDAVPESNNYLYCYNEKNHVGDCRINDDYPICFSHDFNNNPCTAVLFQTDNKTFINFIDEFEVSKTDSGDVVLIRYLIKQIKSKYPNIRPSNIRITGDATGTNNSTVSNKNNYQHIFAEWGLPINNRTLFIRKKNLNDHESETIMNAVLENIEVKINPRCNKLRRDFRIAKFDENEKLYENRSEGYGMDYFDCGKYAITNSFTDIRKIVR